jgi:hypothetical protein
VLDYQFLGVVALVLAVVTRGSLVPVAVVTVVIGLVTLACEATAKWYRRRHPKPPVRSRRGGPAASTRDMNRWMAAVERVLGSPD